MTQVHAGLLAPEQRIDPAMSDVMLAAYCMSDPAKLRATLAAYLRQRGCYEQASVAGDWIHRTDDGDIETLTFEECVMRELSAGAADTSEVARPSHLYANRYGVDTTAVGGALDAPNLGG